MTHKTDEPSRPTPKEILLEAANLNPSDVMVVYMVNGQAFFRSEGQSWPVLCYLKTVADISFTDSFKNSQGVERKT